MRSPLDPAAEEDRLRPVLGEERLADVQQRQALVVHRPRPSRRPCRPYRRPIVKPTLSPMIAAAAARAISSSIDIFPLCARERRAISAVSPGTGMPIVSIAISPNVAEYPTFGGMSMMRREDRVEHGRERYPQPPCAPTRSARRSWPSSRRATTCAARPGSLVPAQHDPSVLLTTAGMHPLKPYFQGQEKPPHHRLTTCQKCFRTPDIDEVGPTTRHLTFFEMLGNFSIGDYFKPGAVEFAWDLSLNGFGFEPERSGSRSSRATTRSASAPTRRRSRPGRPSASRASASSCCRARTTSGRPAPTGPCGPCSELYLDRGLEWGPRTTSRAATTSASWSTGTSSSCSTTRTPSGRLTPLPAAEHRHGLGLNRMALDPAGHDSVFETDQFLPLIKLGERALGHATARRADDRALRILADHTRGMSFLVADGVVPSNEDRGYVLRKLMRRAIYQGRRIGIEGAFLTQYADQVRELMGAAYPELIEQRESVDMWLGARGGGVRPHDRAGPAAARRDDRAARATTAQEGIGADNAFLLHDTYGFPFELTVELAAEQGLGTDAQGFEDLMDQQRARARGRRGPRRPRRRCASSATPFAERRAPTEFTGYETLEQPTEVVAAPRTASPSSPSPRSTRRAAARSPTPATSSTRTAVARVTGVVRARRRPGARRSTGDAASRASAWSRASTARRAGRRSATTRRRTCCTRRCARRSAATCARPAPTSARTSCASTSPTAPR